MQLLKITDYINNYGMRLIEKILLSIIVLATLTAIGQELVLIIEARHATLGDLLLFFIYLEIISMAAAYNKSGRVPVRVPIYIAIVAIARVLILDMKHMSEIRIATLSISAFILAGTIVIIRWGQIKLPYAGATNVSNQSRSGHDHEDDYQKDQEDDDMEGYKNKIENETKPSKKQSSLKKSVSVKKL